MARMPSGAPRSVPDPYGDDYEEMLRRWRADTGQDGSPADPLVPAISEDDYKTSPDNEASLGAVISGSPDISGDREPLRWKFDLDAEPGNSTREGPPSLLPNPASSFDFNGALLPGRLQPSNTPYANLPWGWRTSLDSVSNAGEAPSAPADIPRPMPRRSDIGHSTLRDWLVDPKFGAVREALAQIQELPPIGHPGLAESFMPVEGAGRDAVADLQENDYLGAGANAGLTALDVFGVGELFDGLLKGGLKLEGPFKWRVHPRQGLGARKWLGTPNKLTGMKHLEVGQPGHHAIFPNNGWGKNLPDWFKNQPFNIKPMPSHEIHGRIHGRYKGAPQFNLAQRFWLGTPDWFKAAIVGAAGHPAMTARQQAGNDQ